MRLEIRDIESAMVYDIGPDGAVLGRERARTDISLRDESISKRHARIFMQDGTWFLEDLNSSNGTYVDDQRITVPIRLSQGRLFSLAQRKFEVVYLEGPGVANGAEVSNDFGPPPGAAYEETGAQMPSMASDGGFGDKGYPRADDFAFEDEPDDKGVGAFFVGLPKALGFYLLQVPLMAVNPIGRINRSFQAQPLPAMSNLEVAAYGIPAMFIVALASAVFAFLAQAMNGAVDTAGLVLALPTAGIAAAIGGVGGFIAHPILQFIVSLFKGESTPQSRTNFILFGYVIAIVAVLPQGVGVLVASTPVPYINLLAPLLLLLVSAVGLYFVYQWLKVFDVLKPVQFAALALGGALVIFTAVGFVSGLIDTIDGVPTAPGAVVAGDDSTLTPEQREALANNPAAARALAAAKAAQKHGAPSIKDVLEGSAKKQKEAQALAAQQGDEPPDDSSGSPAGPSDDEPDLAEPAQADPDADDDGASTVANGNGRATDIPTEEHPLGKTRFVVFLEKREAIERAVEDQPSLVGRKDIRRDYERLWRITYDIRDKYYRKKGPRWKKDKIYQRQKGEEIFKRTRKLVDRIYDKLFQSKASKR